MDSRAFSTSSKARLTRHDIGRFPGGSLFDRLGRAVSDAECLPRKELFEAWEVARRARRVFRGGRVIDLGAGHGLLAHVMLLLDDTSASAVAVDVAIPDSAAKIADALTRSWPRLRNRISFVQGGPDDVEIGASDVVVSCHACGGLTDRVIGRAIEARARVAVLPCCHDIKASDAGGLTGWIDATLAIDVVRTQRLRAAGYHVRTQTIPEAITPKNRLILAEPAQDLTPAV